MIDVVVIDSYEGLEALAPELCAWGAVAVDCESNGMHAYRPALCTLQLAEAAVGAAATRAVVIDTLAIDIAAVPWLVALFADAARPKIFHDLGFDARLLGALGVRLGGARDTAVAARFLGHQETGLRAVVLRYFGVTLDKAMQRHDWALRPLDARATGYLAADVVWLGALDAALEAEVQALGIAPEVAEETLYALQKALSELDDARPPFARIKGFRELNAAGRSVLRQLSLLRESLAMQRDCPNGRIVSGANLLAMAKAQPRSLEALKRFSYGSQHPEVFDARWLAAIDEGLARRTLPVDEQAWCSLDRAPSDLGSRKLREEALSSWRTQTAAARGVDLQVVLPGHCLQDLVSQAPADTDGLARIAGLGRVRIARDGETLVALLHPREG